MTKKPKLKQKLTLSRNATNYLNKFEKIIEEIEDYVEDQIENVNIKDTKMVMLRIRGKDSITDMQCIA